MPAYFGIEELVVISAQGKDARRYLNARLSNDIKSMRPGAVLRAAALSAQGRIQAIFTVLCRRDDAFLLISDGADAERLLATAAQFKVADRVELALERERDAAWHIFGHEAAKVARVANLTEAPREGSFGESASGYLFQARRSSESGFDLISREPLRVETESALQAMGAKRISPLQAEYFRIAAGIPSFPNDLNEESLLSESGMHDLVSYAKGCYVGQEVVEKIDSHGKAPRRLVRLKALGRHDLRSGAAVLDQRGKQIGKITSSACSEDLGNTHALAFLRNLEVLPPVVNVDTIAFEVIPDEQRT